MQIVILTWQAFRVYYRYSNLRFHAHWSYF